MKDTSKAATEDELVRAKHGDDTQWDASIDATHGIIHDIHNKPENYGNNDATVSGLLGGAMSMYHRMTGKAISDPNGFCTHCGKEF